MDTIISHLSAMDEQGGRENEVPVAIYHSTSSTHSPSHHDSLTSRRDEHTPWPRHRHLIRTSHILLFFFMTCCLSLTSASIYIEESMVEFDEVQPDESELLKSSLDRLARTGTILVDQDLPPPNPKAWTLATEHDDLQRRNDPFGNQDQDAHSSSSTSMITTAPAASSTKSSGTKSTRTSSTVAPTTEAASPLPVPFDQGFSGNITDSCSNFMYGFLANSTFKACLPFSLLLQNSNSFFQASKSVLRITQTLDATCAADLSICSPLMDSLATNITATANCGADLTSQNPLIQQAHLGLLAYKPLYTATCLRNPNTSSYCFADAVTNASSPTDSYIYYLPLNISLPGGSQPTCDTCLQDTMAVFEAASSNRSSALASDYVAAAQQINVQCGPGFVNQSLGPVAVGMGSSISAAPGVGIVALAVLVGSWLL